MTFPPRRPACRRERATGKATACRRGAKQVATDFGTPGYGGPCPPKGDKPHHYNFTIYALKADKLALPPHATASVAGFIINANALGKAEPDRNLRALSRATREA